MPTVWKTAPSSDVVMEVHLRSQNHQMNFKDRESPHPKLSQCKYGHSLLTAITRQISAKFQLHYTDNKISETKFLKFVSLNADSGPYFLQ